MPDGLPKLCEAIFSARSLLRRSLTYRRRQMFGEHRHELGNRRSLLKQPFEFFIYSGILLPPSRVHSGQPEVLIQFLGRAFELRQRAQLLEILAKCAITI